MKKPVTLIELHEACIELLYAIRTLNGKIERLRENIAGIGGDFYHPWRKEWLHDINISQMAIKRLQLRYSKYLNQLNNYDTKNKRPAQYDEAASCTC